MALYREQFRPETALPVLVQDQIEHTIRDDLKGWASVLEYWQLNDHKPKSVGRMLERYREQTNSSEPDDPGDPLNWLKGAI